MAMLQDPQEGMEVSAEDAGVVRPKPKPKLDSQGKPQKQVAPWRTTVGELMPSIGAGTGAAVMGTTGSVVPGAGTALGIAGGTAAGAGAGRIVGNIIEDKDWYEGIPRAIGEQELYEWGGRAVAPFISMLRGVPWIEKGLEAQAAKIPGARANIPSTHQIMEKSRFADLYRQLAKHPWIAPNVGRGGGELLKWDRRVDPYRSQVSPQTSR